MSNASPFRSPTEFVRSGAVDVRRLAVRPAQFLGFWTAVVAPLAYPLLLVSGLDGQTLLLLLSTVFFVNVLGLVIGRDYRAEA